MALLSAKGLSLGYDSRALIEDLCFELNQGDYLCVVGENGSGKTTLMKTLINLTKPIAGTIEFSSELKRNEIGYLPQQTAVQRDFPASVKEIVYSGFQGKTSFRPFYSKEEKKTADGIMKKMGVADLKDKCYRNLSGGQQQRVLLSRALCAAEKILLLDEPVSGLDPIVTADMYSLIKSLNDEGISIIMVSHDVGAAVKYASHILYIGDTYFYGTKDEFLMSDAGRKLFGEVEDRGRQ